MRPRSKPPRATIEEWRRTDHSRYEVSNLGRVRSYARNPAGRLLKPGLTAQGYPSVTFGRGNTRLVHRLVAVAFLGPIPEGQEVRHKDDDRTNAASANLEYGTRRQNIQDMIDRGRQNIPRGRQKGARVRLTEDSAREIKNLLGVISHRELGLRYGVAKSTINALARGRSWAHVSIQESA